MRPSLTVHPARTLSVQGSVFERWRESAHDAVYVQPYTPLGPTRGNDERRIGETYEVDVAWKLNRSLTLTAQAMHDGVGDAISRAHGADVDFATLVVQYRF